MFNFAILLGIYSYCIFALGLVQLLYKEVVFAFSLIFLAGLLLWKEATIIQHVQEALTFLNKSNIWTTILFSILFIQAFINLIGVLAPELAFDALWYHLTLPKIYLNNHSITHIPGGLLYYSDMPKLGEMLYVGALSLGDEIVAKCMHFIFGLLASFALYKLSRLFFRPLIALSAVVIFYANLVVAWESTTAYIDLIRTFFEILALWAFVLWYQTERRKWFVLSAIMMGLAITTKLLAFGSLLLFGLLIFVVALQRNKLLYGIKNIVIYCFIAVLIPFPWLLFAALHTGNPVYPFFSNIYEITPMEFSLNAFFQDIWLLFTQASDPISPIYSMFLPLILYLYTKFSKEVKLITIFSLFAIIMWYFTPRTGGGRFILPYLPAFSLVCAAVIGNIVSRKKEYGHGIVYGLVLLVLFISVITIGYRALASTKYFPIVFGHESKSVFLANNLNYEYGDFYDVDGTFAKTIKKNETVLLYGFHNLYYVDFTFIDASWVKEGDRFSFIATQKTTLPDRFKHWKLIYTNEQTLVKLYKPPMNGCKKNICVY